MSCAISVTAHLEALSLRISSYLLIISLCWTASSPNSVIFTSKSRTRGMTLSANYFSSLLVADSWTYLISLIRSPSSAFKLNVFLNADRSLSTLVTDFLNSLDSLFIFTIYLLSSVLSTVYSLIL